MTGDVSGRRIRIDGAVTHYLEAGDPDGPLLLLLHDGAWGGSAWVSWGECMLRLAALGYRIIAPDFYGFGGSSMVTTFDESSYAPRMRQIVRLLEVLDLGQPAHLVGTSYGGSVALHLAARDAIPLASVTSIGGTGGMWKTRRMLDELGVWDGTRADLARVVRLLREEGGGFDQQVDRRLQSASVVGHYRAVASAAMPMPSALRRPIAPDDLLGRLSEVQVPVLLIAGTRDELFEREWPERLGEAMPSAVIQRVDSLHSPNLDQPDQIVALLATHCWSSSDAASVHGA